MLLNRLRGLRLPLPAIGAVKHRNFRVFIVGQFISLCGTWMQTVALSWLVLDLTESTLKTSRVTVLNTLPMLLLVPIASRVADRIDKRRMLIVLQALLLLEALALGILAAFGKANETLIYILALLSGVVSAFEIPIRQAFLMEMVGRADLMSAIALNSLAFHLSRVAGPSLAGLVSAAFGPTACFFLNAASFSAVIIGLKKIDPKEIYPSGSGRAGRFGHGLRYIFGQPLLTSLVLVTTAITLFGASIVAILPAYARIGLGVDVGGYGGLVASLGLGAAMGAFLLAAMGERFRRHQVAVAAAAMVGGTLMLLGLTTSYPIAGWLLVIAGLSMALSAILTNTILQTSAPDHVRAQVVAFYSFIVIGIAPFGSELAGQLGERFGPSTAIAMGGGACLLVTIIAAWRVRTIPLVSGASP